MPAIKRWNLAPTHEAAAELAGRLKVSPLVAQILLNRGISEPDDCHRFLKPTLKDLHDPALIAGLPKAAERIARAIKDREKIVIYGDYDVDGITSVTILWHAIKLLGGDVHYYIPHRIDEGYGLNSEAIAEICKDGAQLVITVDCGVTAIEQAKVAGRPQCGSDHYRPPRVEGIGFRGPGSGVRGRRRRHFPEPGTRNPEPATPSGLRHRPPAPSARGRIGLPERQPLRRRRGVQAGVGHRPGGERTGESFRRVSSISRRGDGARGPRHDRRRGARSSARTGFWPTTASAV